jgi:hypothetical protein
MRPDQGGILLLQDAVLVDTAESHLTIGIVNDIRRGDLLQ